MVNSSSSKGITTKGDYQYLSGNYKKAISYFKQAIINDKRNAEPYYKIGLIYYQFGQPGKAIKYLKSCTDLVRKNPVAQILYGKLLLESGNINSALRAYRLALKSDRENIDAISGMASVYEYNKDYTKAYKIIEPIIKSKRVNSQVVILFTRFCLKIGRCQQAIEYAEFCLKSGEIIESDVISFIYYAIGDLEDKTGNYNNAFNAYQKANNARKLQYDPYNYNNLIETTKSTYNFSYFLKAKKSTNASERPVFIVGMPRSGTSLVEQILSSHSEVFGAGELNTVGNILNKITRNNVTADDYIDTMLKLNAENLDHCASLYLDALYKLNQKAKIVTDKMPHNYTRLGFISQLFPKCKIIHCVRNPIDTCLSIYFKSFNDSHDYATEFEALAHQYKKYKELMGHWKSVLPIQIYEIRYEDLITDFEVQTKNLISFCQLEWEPQCLTFYNTKRHVATASQEQVSQPIYNSSINRWKNYEPHIQTLIKELKSADLI